MTKHAKCFSCAGPAVTRGAGVPPACPVCHPDSNAAAELVLMRPAAVPNQEAEAWRASAVALHAFVTTSTDPDDLGAALELFERTHRAYPRLAS